MSLFKVANVVGLLQVFVAATMLLTGLLALVYGDGDAGGILLSALVTATFGTTIYFITRFEEDVTTREGFAIVTVAWAATAFFGGLPYLLTGVTGSPVAAVFEAMSGFTTTGATIFTDIEALPHGVLFWRSMTHWIGGMGIIVLVIAVLPYLGVGGMQLFQAEVPGPTHERLRPRITQTAKLLWLVYFGLTAVLTLLYVVGGMSLFDAVNHAFSTMATGGFSTSNTSMMEMSAFIQWVTILFMFLAGVNYTLHFRAATGNPVYLRDEEWRFYGLVTLLAALAIAGANAVADLSPGLEQTLRDALFQTLTIITTTGYVSADYEQWVPGAKLVLFALFFVGGMAGSTAGGIKTLRVMLLLKQTGNELRKHLHPRAILVARIGGKPVKDDVGARVVGFVMLYLLICLAGAIGLALLGLDVLTAIGGSIATVGNVGPAFADLGPTANYGWLGWPQLALMTFLMLVGRLEIFTVLILFHPELWRARRAFHR
jgi:trk system potassium uptake protein TrkH